MIYNYVLPYTKGMKVHYLEFLIDKLRMVKGLKGISEENALDYSIMCQIFKKISLTFPGFRRLFDDKKSLKEGTITVIVSWTRFKMKFNE